MFTTFPADQLQQTGAAENKVDMLDVPGKGRCYVYIARYTCIISYITGIKNIYNLHSYKLAQNPVNKLLLLYVWHTIKNWDILYLRLVTM